jgi:hypothetical protein
VVCLSVIDLKRIDAFSVMSLCCSSFSNFPRFSYVLLSMLRFQIPHRKMNGRSWFLDVMSIFYQISSPNFWSLWQWQLAIRKLPMTSCHGSFLETKIHQQDNLEV